MIRRPPRSTLFPYTRSSDLKDFFKETVHIGFMARYIVLLPVVAVLTVFFIIIILRKKDFRRANLFQNRSEEHTSELQSHSDLVCRLLLEKRNVEATSHVYVN